MITTLLVANRGEIARRILRTAAAMGLRDMVVVHADGATLTCRISDSDQVRRVSEAVRARGTP